ncbi:MAG TPA: type II toxin-antitoxin system VapC family toxin [Candidatus Acidoferrales bacterium]|nr:type II toxin-antitoxin system VapC family toxin [Candidatus Acidoferrales bacterium]
MVIDASVALAWCFPDEDSDYADGVLAALEGRAIVVPALWPIEVTNAVLVAERRKRIRPLEIRRFVELLDNLSVSVDSRSVTECVNNVLPLAREYGLSAYDAAYLDVAMQRGAPLATLDGRLQRAGREVGIEIFRSGRE